MFDITLAAINELVIELASREEATQLQLEQAALEASTHWTSLDAGFR
jgi:hypothetical protein